MKKWECDNCDCKVDDFDLVWDHINGFSHTMSLSNPKRTIIDGGVTRSGLNLTDDEYLFLANCTKDDFLNFFVWREKT